MTKFEDQLFDDLMREHGPALVHTRVPAPRKHRVAARGMLLGGAGTLAAAGAVGGILAAGTGTPAYAITKNPDGTMTLAVYQKSGIGGINARLRALGDDQVVVVPVEPGCPSSLPKPPVPGRGHMISVGIGRAPGGSVTVRATGIPAGDIMVVGIKTSGHSPTGVSALTSAPAPRCISLPALSSGNGTTESVKTAP
jgi:hypothetical protein